MDRSRAASPREAVVPVEAALAAARAAVNDVLAGNLATLGSTALVDCLDAVVALRRQAEAAYLHVLAEVDRRGVAADAGARSTAGWLRQRHLVSGAGADVAAAQETAGTGGQLPELGRALADGELSRAHVDAAVRCLSRLPASLRAERRAEVAGFLVEQARRLTPRELDAVGRTLLSVLDPDGAARFDPDAVDRRALSMATDQTGMLVGSFQLDPAAGALVATALHHFAAPEPKACVIDEDGQRVLGVEDRRSATQRYADSLTLMARAALGSPGVGSRVAGTRGGELPRIVVHTTPAQLAGTTQFAGAAHAGLATCEQTGPIPGEVLARLACDAVLDRVALGGRGEVLELGRTQRLASPAQRRALGARDRGCIIPGCGALPSWCDAHHVVPWLLDGPTDLANLVLLCPGHHTQVHVGRWRIVVRDGLPWAIPPPQIDPQQRPVRNQLPHILEQARRLAEQLALDDTG